MRMPESVGPLEVAGLCKTFAGQAGPVVDEVAFQVQGGEVFVLLGPSGCGKTTTLRLIAGFEVADAGDVRYAGRVLQNASIWLPPEKRGVGFVFQDYALFPHLTVLRNVMFGIRGLPRRRRAQSAREALWMVSMGELADRMPHDLSGGQQQRVALARAIASGARIILLDEPFSSLDANLRQATRREVRDLAERAGLAVVLVTHDQEEALSTADRLAVMHEGRLLQVGPPQEVYDRPRSAFVAQFLGRTNLLHAEAQGHTARTVLGEVPLDRPATGRVLLSLRPERLRLEADPQGEAVVEVREYKGHDVGYTVRQHRRVYLVQSDHTSDFTVGQRVRLVAAAPAYAILDSARPAAPADAYNVGEPETRGSSPTPQA